MRITCILFILIVLSFTEYRKAQQPYPYPSVQQPRASSGNGYVRPFATVKSVDSEGFDLFEEEDEDEDDENIQPEFRVVQPMFPNTNRPLTIPPSPVIEQPQPGEIPPPPEPAATEKPDNSYAINYCDKTEFSDETLAQYGLERVNYFIYNTSCSHIFFQCSIGQTFLLQCTSADQAFDKATENCNFRNAIKICPEYDHVLHCTIKETCTANEYACCASPQMCIHMSKRCDGHSDCADGEDENNCPSCAKDEYACVKSGECIPANKRCDGVADDCGDGSNLDEIGCSKNTTCIGKFMCDQSRGGVTCIDWENHCDGTSDCLSGEDEMNCKQMDKVKYLLCENQKQSVTKLQWCNGELDCADGSDEKYCY